MVYKPKKVVKPLKRAIDMDDEEEYDEEDEQSYEEEIQNEVTAPPKNPRRQVPQEQPQQQTTLTRNEVKDMIVGNLERAVELVRLL